MAVLLCFGVLFVSAVDAEAPTPTNILQASYMRVSPNPAGPTALAAVHNTSGIPVTVVMTVKTPGGNSVASRTQVLVGKETWTVNFRDWDLPVGDDGLFTGFVVVYADRRTVVGDLFIVNPGEDFAQGDRLWSRYGECVSGCEDYVIRFFAGGAFSGGTGLRIYHDRNLLGSNDILFDAYEESGEFVGSFFLSEPDLSSYVEVGNLGLPVPFGTFYVHLPATGLVDAVYSAEGRYSIGLAGWCVPPCDPCDPQGDCYDPADLSCQPACIPAVILVTGDSHCVVGIFCSTMFEAAGTGVGPMSFSALPSGLSREGNTVSGLPTVTGSYSVSVSGTCGDDEVTIEILEGPPPPPPAGEGCTPGYWRQEHHYDSWTSTGYVPTDLFDVVFGRDASDPDWTLGEAVALGGGGLYALSRHATAALLNASHPNVNYPYTAAEVVSMFQAAFDSGEYASAHDVFAAANELGCPLN